MIYISCPRCHADAPATEFMCFFRWYDGDVGWVTCPVCHVEIRWTMSITVAVEELLLSREQA